MTHVSACVDLAAVSDGQLMVEIKAGSVGAFGGLYDRYSDRAYRIALSVCRDRGQAEDAVQNAFISIWKNPGGYQAQRGTVAAWLLTSVRYRAVDVVRKSSADAARLEPEDRLDTYSAPDDTCEQVAALDLTDRMHALLAQIPDAQQEVIRLAFYGGLSHTEIAERLGLRAGTVKGRIRLGLHKLRANVDREIA